MVESSLPAAGRSPASLADSKNLALAALGFSVFIFGGQFVGVRMGVTSSFTAFDIASLRFIFAGVIMLPVFIRLGWRDCCGLGWGKGIALAATGGAPMIVTSNIGLTLAPALHGTCIQPGSVPIFTALFAAMAMRALPPRPVLLGLPVVFAGLVILALGGSAQPGQAGASTLAGDLVFLGAGALWAGMTFLGHRWRVQPLVAAAVIAVLSLAYVPVHLLFLPSKLGTAPVGMILFQGFYQGVLVLILGQLIWSWGLRRLGAEVTARFSSLTPVAGFLLAIPVLGEWPTGLQWTGMLVVVLGLLGVSLLRRR